MPKCYIGLFGLVVLMSRIFREKKEQRFDLAYILTLFMLFIQSPIILIPILGPSFFATLSSFMAGKVGSRYVEKNNGPLAAFLATATFYTGGTVFVVLIMWLVVDPMPGIFRPYDLTVIILVAILIIISGIFSAIGGYVGSKPLEYYEE